MTNWYAKLGGSSKPRKPSTGSPWRPKTLGAARALTATKKPRPKRSSSQPGARRAPRTKGY